MADESNIYYRAFLENYGKISSAVAGAGSPNMINLSAHLMQSGLINPPDHLAIAPGTNPTQIANNLCTVVMSNLKGEPQYEKLLQACRSTGYDYPIRLLQKTLQGMTAASQGLLRVIYCLYVHLPCMQ